ncbi:r2r3-myb transcription factor, putative [Ricinus communis]|uniref:R2r3-myb transcription factor, putative n=1 Tax=Ricinus communis TaxID=3988 RepID=B9S0E2_RICCO|nr:r2r3-myb transcription factor, putative [Ricinus communis]
MAFQVASNQGEKLRKGPWVEEEDEQLVTFVTIFGDRKWDFIATASGLKRSGKSCRLRWLNYLRPNLKRGHISPEEEQIIIQLHELWGNKYVLSICYSAVSHLKKKIEAQEGNFQCKADNAKKDFLYQKGDTGSWKSHMEDYKSIKDNIVMSDSPLEQYELSSLTYLNSPYETRIYDWMSMLSNEQSGMKIHGDCGGFGSCYCYLMKWNAEDGDSSMLDTLGSLWNMN